MKNTCTIMLAAGKGTRMNATKSKVLHEILAQPLIDYVTDVAHTVSSRTVAVIGHQREQVGPYLAARGIETVVQDPPLGTGHAVAQAEALLKDAQQADVLIIPGDMPLIRAASIQRLIELYRAENATMGVLTAILPEPHGYGRIIRAADGRLERIVEQADASEAEAAVSEVNTSVYVVKREFLFEAVRNIKPNNKKGEYYLTDILAMADTVVASPTLEACEASGINSQVQLAEAAGLMQARINLAHQEAGVCIHDPLNAYIGPQVAIERDVTVWPGAQAYGRCLIGAGATLGPDCRLRDQDVAAGQVCG